MKVVLASHNQGKIREFSALLKPFAVEIIPQSELRVSDIEETGLSFIENAILKARNACQLTGLPAIADDSGLVVPALNGAPGIYSARYAGPEAVPKNNIQKLLAALEHFSDEQRAASFHCVLVYMQHALDPMPVICTGEWQGKILREPRGTNGFGYDPVFFVPEENKAAAELPLGLKNKISHRSKALHALVTVLAEKFRNTHDGIVS